MLTKLFDNKSDDITLSRLLRILRTYSALLLPFFSFKSIRGLEVAVNAVSEPDRKPDKTINISKQIIRIIVIVDIYLRAFLILLIFKLLLKKADPILLEPMMAVEVETPEEYMGDVMGDLSSRRGIVQGMEDNATGKVIRCEVPLAEMFGYSTTVRSLSQGRATYSMEFKHYSEAPRNVAEEVVAKVKGVSA